MNTKKNYQCIIFDCDGTLIDSEYLCNLALEMKLRELGINEAASEMMIRYRGGKLANIILSLEEKHSIKFSKNFEKSYREIVAQLFETKLKPIPGIIEVLESIDIPYCVASSGPVKKIEQALAITHLKHFFGKNIYSSYDVGSWKPEPGLFLYAAKHMGFKPKECVVIEDSLLGVQAAVAGGFDVYAFANPENKDQFEKIATKVFLDMKELKELLEQAMKKKQSD